MKNKKLIIGGAVAVVLGYFLLKKKPVSNPFPEGKLEEESRPLLPSFDEGLHVGIWDPDKWNFDAMENVLGRGGGAIYPRLPGGSCPINTSPVVIDGVKKCEHVIMT